MFNHTITHYHFFNECYTRSVITNVFWDNVKRSNVLKSGAVMSDKTLIVIPTTQIIPFTLSKDIIVFGNIPFTFDNTSQQTISNGISYLKNNFDNVVTVNICDYKILGNLPHIELSCV